MMYNKDLLQQFDQTHLWELVGLAWLFLLSVVLNLKSYIGQAQWKKT